MTLPIIASSFGIVSLIAPLTNIIVLPLIPYIMLFVLIAGIGAVIFIKLGTVLALAPLNPDLVCYFRSAIFFRHTLCLSGNSILLGNLDRIFRVGFFDF